MCGEIDGATLARAAAQQTSNDAASVRVIPVMRPCILNLHVCFLCPLLSTRAGRIEPHRGSERVELTHDLLTRVGNEYRLTPLGLRLEGLISALRALSV